MSRSSTDEAGALRRRRRWPWVIVGAVALVVATLVVVRQVVLRDRSRTVTTDQALDRYRRSTTTTAVPSTTVTSGASSTEGTTAATAPPAPVLPAVGVYRYRTIGSESIDVLGGAHHDYPADTTLTVTPDGCGVRLRWDALQERRDEWRLCPTPDGLVEPWTLQYHEFFKQPDPEELVCPPDTLLLPSAPVAGAAWDAACTLAGDPEPQHFEVVGTEAVTVDGQTVPAVHLRQLVDIDGDSYEHTTTDWWLAPSGLPLRSTQTKQSRSSSPIGPVTYHEEYTIELTSLQPLH